MQKTDANGAAIGLPWVYENPLTGATRSNGAKMDSEPNPFGINNGIYAPPEPIYSGDPAPDIIFPRHADALNLAAG